MAAFLAAHPGSRPELIGTGVVVVELHLQPRLRAAAESLFETDRHVGADRRLLVEDNASGVNSVLHRHLVGHVGRYLAAGIG